MVFVEDIAALVTAWLQQAEPATGVFAFDDGAPGGYNWRDVAGAVSRLCRRPVRLLRIPPPVMDIPALINRSFARVFGYAPMLTPEKLRELRHPDWVCDNAALQQVLAWQPHYRLAEGLAATPGWCGKLST
jgi:nucleoside-diphosphate-sugar epimerase